MGLARHKKRCSLCVFRRAPTYLNEQYIVEVLLRVVVVLEDLNDGEFLLLRLLALQVVGTQHHRHELPGAVGPGSWNSVCYRDPGPLTPDHAPAAHRGSLCERNTFW